MSVRDLATRRVQPAIAVAALVLLSIPTLQPLLASQLTCGYDNVLHMWRAIETDALLQAGIPYARWQPHMALGFGYPLHIFQSPASPLVAALIHRVGLAWPSAVNATFAAGTLLTALTTWLLLREWTGDLAAVVAGVIVITIPFHAYVTYHRGSMSEVLAWPFPPLILWGLIRWQKHVQRLGLTAAAGGMAGLVLTHDATAYLFLPMALLASAALTLAYRSPRALGRGLMALGLGLGLAACFWMPSVLERGSVQFGRVTEYPYAASFVALDYLLELPRGVDPTMVNPWLPKGIGTIPAILALLAVLAWWRGGREERFWLGGIGLATLGCIWLATPYAAPIWRLIPTLQYLHFPWRFLTPAALGVAVLAGAGTHALLQLLPRVSLAAFPAAVAALCIGSLGWLYPPRCPLPQSASLAGLLAYERQTAQWGTTTFGELTPRWVEVFPSSAVLEAAIEAGDEPTRLEADSLPAGARILSAQYSALQADIELETPATITLTYQAFYYPGWEASVDGDPVPVGPSASGGLLTFAVPAGRHALHVGFAETPLRLAADGLSLASLLALGLTLWYTRGTDDSPRDQPVNRQERSFSPAWILLGVAILIPALKLGIIDRTNTPLRQPNLVDGQLAHVDVPADVLFGDEFVLLGHAALPERVTSGERFELSTYWRATEPGGPDYGVTVHIVDRQGLRWDDVDIRPPRWHRTPPPVGEWSADQYALIAMSIPLKVGTPPDTYTVELVAFDRATLAPMTAHAADGQTIGPALAIGQIVVTPPRRPPAPDTLALEHRLDAMLGPLMLLDAHLDRDEVAPGDSALFTALWRAQESPGADLSLHLALVAPDGVLATEAILPPAAGYPTSAWQAGDVWCGQHMLRLPADLQGGHYRWTLRLCPSGESDCWPPGQSLEFGELLVRAPDRQWEAPALDITTDVRLGDVVTLLGANLAPDATTTELRPGDSLAVTLAWRAERGMDRSYRVFLHLLRPDGAPVTQSDGEPADWSRPTTGWLPGEVVLDQRRLTVPESATPGEYALQAGMYTLEEGRLAAPDGRDTVRLATVLVGPGQ